MPMIADHFDLSNEIDGALQDADALMKRLQEISKKFDCPALESAIRFADTAASEINMAHCELHNELGPSIRISK